MFYRFEGALAHAVALYFPRKFLTLRYAVYACKKREHLIRLLTNTYTWVLQCIVSYYCVITAEQFNRYQNLSV